MADVTVAPSLEDLRARARGLELYLIEMRPTSAWHTSDEEERRALLREHLLWQERQEREGVLVLSGPIDPDSTPGHGLAVVRADSAEAAAHLAEGEPFARAGLRTNVIRRWVVNEGSITLTVRLFAGAGDLH